MADLFSNRELASAIWACLIAVWAATHADIRKGLGHLVGALLNRHVLRILAQTTIYAVTMIAILSWAGLWTLANLKITIYWYLFVAIVMVFRSNQETSNPKYFRQTLRDNINLVVLLEYIVNFHSFNIVAELVILPIVTLIVMVQAFSERKEKYKSIQAPLNVLLGIYLLSLLIHAVYQASADPLEFVSAGALTDFLLPPLLSIAFLPFMFFLLTYFAYGQAFSRIRFLMPEELLADAKWISFKKFRGDRLLLLRWARIASYSDINSRSGLVKSIDDAKYMKWRERHPSIITFEHGWAPGIATQFLTSLGLIAGDYDPSFDGIWTASSDYLPLRDESPVLCNNVAYYIYGSWKSVQQLKLKLNVNEPNEAEAAHEIFLDCCDELAARALDRAIDPAIRDAILSGKNQRGVIRERIVNVELHDWAGSSDKAYEVKFEIYHPDFEPR